MKHVIATMGILAMMASVPASARQVGRSNLAEQYMELAAAVGQPRAEVERQLAGWGYRLTDSVAYSLSCVAPWALQAGHGALQGAAGGGAMWVYSYTLAAGEETCVLSVTHLQGRMCGFSTRYSSPNAKKVYGVMKTLSQMQSAVASAGCATRYAGKVQGQTARRCDSHGMLADVVANAGFRGTRTCTEEYRSLGDRQAYSVHYVNDGYGKKHPKRTDVATLTVGYRNDNVLSI